MKAFAIFLLFGVTLIKGFFITPRGPPNLCGCPTIYVPVCASNHCTYLNRCVALCDFEIAGKNKIDHEGECLAYKHGGQQCEKDKETLHPELVNNISDNVDKDNTDVVTESKDQSTNAFTNNAYTVTKSEDSSDNDITNNVYTVTKPKDSCENDITSNSYTVTKADDKSYSDVTNKAYTVTKVEDLYFNCDTNNNDNTNNAYTVTPSDDSNCNDDDTNNENSEHSCYCENKFEPQDYQQGSANDSQKKENNKTFSESNQNESDSAEKLPVRDSDCGKNKTKKPCDCTGAKYEPVCGKDSKTYDNVCSAYCGQCIETDLVCMLTLKCKLTETAIVHKGSCEITGP